MQATLDAPAVKAVSPVASGRPYTLDDLAICWTPTATSSGNGLAEEPSPGRAGRSASQLIGTDRRLTNG